MCHPLIWNDLLKLKYVDSCSLSILFGLRKIRFSNAALPNRLKFVHRSEVEDYQPLFFSPFCLLLLRVKKWAVTHRWVTLGVQKTTLLLYEQQNSSTLGFFEKRKRKKESETNYWITWYSKSTYMLLQQSIVLGDKAHINYVMYNNNNSNSNNKNHKKQLNNEEDDDNNDKRRCSHTYSVLHYREYR